MLSKNRLKYLCSLKQKKYRRESRKFLVEGIKLCEEALKSNFYVETIFICPPIFDKSKQTALLQLLNAKRVETVEISTNELKKLSTTVQPQGAIGLIHIKDYQLNELQFGESATILALEKLMDPGNLGTIIRTADWFGIDAILLGKETVELYNAKVIRATMGSLFHLPLIHDVDLPAILNSLKKKEFQAYAATINGNIRSDQIQLPNRKILILGNESMGISPKLIQLVDETITIPGSNRADSLNVAIAAGILLYQFATPSLL